MPITKHSFLKYGHPTLWSCPIIFTCREARNLNVAEPSPAASVCWPCLGSTTTLGKVHYHPRLNLWVCVLVDAFSANGRDRQTIHKDWKARDREFKPIQVGHQPIKFIDTRHFHISKAFLPHAKDTFTLPQPARGKLLHRQWQELLEIVDWIAPTKEQVQKCWLKWPTTCALQLPGGTIKSDQKAWAVLINVGLDDQRRSKNIKGI